MTILITGGAGYLGSVTAALLASAGHDVRVVDALLHGQRHVAAQLKDDGIDVQIGDIRDRDVRGRALDGITAVVHLAAIVGDVACRTDPETSDSTNVTASAALAREAHAAGVQHFVAASTCSNYGVVDGHHGAVEETHELRPVSRYARQKVAMEQDLEHALAAPGMAVTALRFATLYGVSPRMRFDLLVNDFTRDAWAGRDLEVYGGQTWRPYVHVHDAARTIAAALARPDTEHAPHLTCNVGDDDANLQKIEVARLVARVVGQGTVTETTTGDDQRTYRVSFARIRERLGITPEWSVERGIEEIHELLRAGALDDPFAPALVNA